MSQGRGSGAPAERPGENARPGPPPAQPHPHLWMGGKPGARFTKPQRRRTMLRLLELDGPYCRWPGCPFWGRAEEAPDLGALLSRFEVNHVGGPAEHWLDLVELMHGDCNRKARFDPAEQERYRGARSQLLVRENAGAPADAYAALHGRVDYQAGSTEMQVNDDAEPVWENWFWAVLKLLGRLTKYEAINVGANKAGWSTQAARRAYEKRVWVPHKMLGEHPELAVEEFAGEVVDRRDGTKHKVRMVRLRAGWAIELARREGDDGPGDLRPRRAEP